MSAGTAAQPASTHSKTAPNPTFWVAAALCAASLPALLARGTVESIASLRALALTNPYYHPEHAGLLYLWMPVVALSSFVFYLLPGIFLVGGIGQAKSRLELILLAFGAALGTSIFLETGVKAVFGAPFRSDTLVWSWVALSAAAGLFFIGRNARRQAGIRETGRPEKRRLLSMAAISLAAVAVLTPKLFWENFNLDGMEAFEFGRSLTNHVLPHWDIQGGAFGFYHNFVLFAYPNHWFIALFGPVEGAVRLPYILYAVLLFAVLVLLIEHGSARLLRGVEEAALWLGLALFSVVQIYNTTYDPFFSDMSEPGATDTLLLVCFLSACFFIWSHRLGFFLLFAALTYLATVGGSALLLALAATVALWQTPRRVEYLKAFAVLGCICGIFAVTHETLYNSLVLGGAKDQFSTRNMAARLFPPTLTEFWRLGALLFPSGLLPFLSIAAVRRKDWIAWSAGVMTVLYGGLIYIQCWTGLHQFTPAMVLPFIVFWRVYLNGTTPRARQWLLPGILITTAGCMLLSLPRHFTINHSVREFGEATSFEVGDYDGGYETAVHAGSSVLNFLLPGDYRIRYPDQPWGMDDQSWVYYSFRAKPAGTTANYIVRSASAPAPDNTTLAGSNNGFAVYVRDSRVWERDRNQTLPRVIQSPLYEPILNHMARFFRDYVAQKRLEQERKLHQRALQTP